MKKILALLLALLLCASLCACGQEKAAEVSDTRSDVTVTPIPKPAETPAPTAAPVIETPAPTAAPAEIEVTELCSMHGRLANESGFMEYYSYSLPQVSGPDTDYLRQLNEDMEAVYEAHVLDAAETVKEYGYLPCYSACFLHGETDGIHSLLVTCDSDWGAEYYWCYNFDEKGNEVDNAALLKAAGLTAEQFVERVRAYLADATDLSEYFDDDDGWKTLQEQTLAKNNCNADMPMVLLPDGNLGFIAHIYTPAGAGEYDHALALTQDGDVDTLPIGSIQMSLLLSGEFLVDTSDMEDDSTGYLMEFFTVGDTLSMEITGFDVEEAEPYFYYAADIYPLDPADLLKPEGTPMRVRVLTHCPDIFGGTYYGEAGEYTLTVTRDGVAFTDFGGGTPLIVGDQDVCAVSCYRYEVGLDDPTPELDYELFDYDTVEKTGLAGIWGGQYMDLDNVNHNVYLEMTNWGQMILRDCPDGGYPRILKGSYYISGEHDEIAPTSGLVVFDLAAVGGYKMPVRGYCYAMVDEDGFLLLADDDETDLSTLLQPNDNVCCMTRVAENRYVVEPQIIPLTENETVSVDICDDGNPVELGYFFERDKDNGDAISEIVIVLNGEEYSLDNTWIYDAEVYLVVPSLSGEVYFYVDGQSDNDYHYTQILATDGAEVWLAGEFYGGFAEEPTDAEHLRLDERFQILSTAQGVRTYRVGMNGLPENVDALFQLPGGVELTAKRDVDCWIVDADSGELLDTDVLPAGEKVTMARTDGVSFIDLKRSDGEYRRVWVDHSEWPQTIGGVDIEECFDGTRFAG